MISEDSLIEYGEENEEEWRQQSRAWLIPDFFEVLKDHFRRLVFVPFSTSSVYYCFKPNSQVDRLRQIYRNHGWPDLERYRKKECMEAVGTAMKEIEEQKEKELMAKLDSDPLLSPKIVY